VSQREGRQQIIEALEALGYIPMTDFDLQGIASTFGWTPCECGSTDGTGDCAHRKASDMIAEAQAFLDDHIGDQADDPGYFE
jgi:hypothetical protein